MERDGSRCNCRTLFGAGRIPCDNRIRNLLDDLDPAACDPLFRPCLATVAAQGALEPFQRLDERLPAAPDGVRFHRSDKVHCPQCSVRRVGSERRPHHFQTMADGHATVLPLMPEFVCPQQDAAATRADMSEDERKRDCERNAAKRRIAARGAWLQACRATTCPAASRSARPPRRPAWTTSGYASPDPTSTCTRCRRAGGRAARCARPAGCRGAGRASAPSGTVSAGRPRCPCARAATPCGALGSSTPWSATASAPAPAASSPVSRSPRTTADNAERIARAGRARWKIENEGCNCLARHGRNCKRNFGHGKEGPANVPAVPNLFAFALHAVLQCVCALRQQCRRQPVTRRALFRELQVALRWFRFPDRPTLLAAVRAGRAPPGCRAAGAWTPRGLDSAQFRAGSVRRAAGRQSRLPPECVRPRARHSADPRRGPRHGPARRPTLPRGGLGSATSRSTYSPHPPKQRSRTPLTDKFRTAAHSHELRHAFRPLLRLRQPPLSRTVACTPRRLRTPSPHAGSSPPAARDGPPSPRRASRTGGNSLPLQGFPRLPLPSPGPSANTPRKRRTSACLFASSVTQSHFNPCLSRPESGMFQSCRPGRPTAGLILPDSSAEGSLPSLPFSLPSPRPTIRLSSNLKTLACNSSEQWRNRTPSRMAGISSRERTSRSISSIALRPRVSWMS